MCLGKFGEALWCVAQRSCKRLRLCTGSGVCGTIVRGRRDQNVRGFVEVG